MAEIREREQTMASSSHYLNLVLWSNTYSLLTSRSANDPDAGCVFSVCINIFSSSSSEFWVDEGGLNIFPHMRKPKKKWTWLVCFFLWKEHVGQLSSSALFWGVFNRKEMMALYILSWWYNKKKLSRVNLLMLIV